MCTTLLDKIIHISIRERKPNGLYNLTLFWPYVPEYGLLGLRFERTVELREYFGCTPSFYVISESLFSTVRH